VRGYAATVLGHDGPQAVDVERGFLDMGFDSLTGLELRTRLGAATGRRLPPTLVFDHPSVTAVADHLCEEMFGPQEPGADLSTASADELFSILDHELGLSEQG
jgi:hypothetical protein